MVKVRSYACIKSDRYYHIETAATLTDGVNRSL